jgi:S1-C subfamily serine protease
MKSSPLLPRIVAASITVTLCAVQATGQTQDSRQIARKVFPSVVLLEMNDSSGQTVALGSGFFVREDVIATNYHVIKGRAGGFAKIVGQNQKYRIMGVVAVDPQHDLVLLQLSQVRAVPLKLGDVSQLETGEPIYALGNPEGLEGTISPGIVSGIRLRQLGGETLMQITAPISHGSSGGPVVNVRGEVIGVAVSYVRDGQNLNFAVPAPYLALLLASMRSPVPLGSTGIDEITNTVPTRDQPARFTSGRYGISFIPPANSLEELNSKGLPKYTGTKSEFGPVAILNVTAIEECKQSYTSGTEDDAFVAGLIKDLSTEFQDLSVVGQSKVNIGGYSGIRISLTFVSKKIPFESRIVILKVIEQNRCYLFNATGHNAPGYSAAKWFREVDNAIQSLTIGRGSR